MILTGLHILLTYQCTYECEHCFVWGSPNQSGVFTLSRLRQVFEQAKETGTIKTIYFEGGEPFLYYAILIKAVQEAHALGFEVGIVSNAYWATTLPDAQIWLQPLAGLVGDLSVSSDIYHYDEKLSQQAQHALDAAQNLGIPVGVISVAAPEATEAIYGSGTLPHGESGVMYRGRAAEKLVHRAGRRKWDTLTECPYEDLRDPGRLHLDPFGNLHICQGISIGNLFDTPLNEILAAYNPDNHPICGPLLAGGPAALARRYQIEPEPGYADACHFCDQVRHKLRSQFPAILAPGQMYGIA